MDLLLLRSLLTPELRIAPGRVLMARVVSAGLSGKGALSIAGAVIDAELPKQVRAGQDLRLVVKEVSQERVVLSLADQTAVTPAPPPVELPGGGRIRLTERETAEQDDATSESHTITLRYDAPALGGVDLRLDLDAGSLRVAIALPQGAPVALATEASDELRQELADGSERRVNLTISARYEPLDLYA